MILNYTKKDMFFWLGFIFGLAFIRIGYLFSVLSVYRYGVQVLRVAFILICLPFIFKMNLTMKQLITYLSLAIFCAIIFFRTISNDGDYVGALFFAGSLLFVPLFFISISREKLFSLLDGLALFFKIILLCEFICMILFRNTGMYRVGRYTSTRAFYFLGHRNADIKFTLPAITLFAVLDLHKEKRLSLSTIFFTVATVFFNIYVNAITAVVGVFIYVAALYLCLYRKEWVKKIPIYTPVYVSILIFFVICFMQTSLLSRSISPIVSFLGRDASLSGRVTIWNMTVKAITDNMFGYGYLTDYTRWLRFANTLNQTTYVPSSAHNIYFDILMQGGIMSLPFFMFYIIRCVEAVPKAECLAPVTAYLFAALIMWNFEPYFSEDIVYGGWIVLSMSSAIGDRKRSNTDKYNVYRTSFPEQDYIS